MRLLYGRCEGIRQRFVCCLKESIHRIAVGVQDFLTDKTALFVTAFEVHNLILNCFENIPLFAAHQTIANPLLEELAMMRFCVAVVGLALDQEDLNPYQTMQRLSPLDLKLLLWSLAGLYGHHAPNRGAGLGHLCSQGRRKFEAHRSQTAG